MFSVKIKGAEKLAKDLQKAKQTAVPYAIRTYLTTAAFEARKVWQGELRKDFTLRNQYTERSIIAVKASGSLPTMQSKVGSFASYMGQAEEDSRRAATGRWGIPGAAAAGQAPGSKRTRVVRAAARLGALHVAHPNVSGSKARRNAAAIRLAVQRGSGVALLERPGGGKGLFKVSGGRRRFTGRSFTQRAVKVRLLWDVSRRSVHVPGSHTLAHALKVLEPKHEHMMQAALLEQLRRHHVLGY